MASERDTIATPQPERTGDAARLLLVTNARFVVPALVLAVTFVAYMGTVGYAFVYDDIFVVVENPTVHSWHSVPRFFTEHLWGFRYAVGSYYRPIFLLWLTFNNWLFGLNPAGWHLAAILLHVGVTLLVFLLVRRFTRDRATAAIASLVFGLHPAHIEAVAWISGATESLLAVLFLGSFLCYIKYRDGDKGKSRWLTAALVLAVLTVLAKEQGVVLAAVVFAYELLLKQRDYIADSTFDSVEWQRLLIRNSTLDEVSEDLKGQGVTYILYRPAIFQWVALYGREGTGGSGTYRIRGQPDGGSAAADYEPEVRNWSTFEMYRLKYLETVRAYEGYTILRIK